MPRRRHVKKKENAKNTKIKNEADKTKIVEIKKVVENPHLKLETYYSEEKIQEIKNIMKSRFSPDFPPILGAVVLNDIELCKEVLQKCGNEVINMKFQNDVSPLLLATKCANFKTVEFLISRGADPWFQDKEGENSIMNAINNKDMVESDFLNFWKQVKNITALKLNSCGKSGNSLLHLVLRRQWKKVLNLLLKFKQIEVNIKNLKGITPLMIACVRNDLISVDKLMDAGASPLQEDNKCCTALCYTIAMYQKRDVGLPHLCINSVLLFTDDIQKINYIKGRLNLVLNKAPESDNLIMKTITTIIPVVIRYFVRYIEEGIAILLDENVFQLLYLAIQKHLKELDHLNGIVQIILEILKLPDAFLEKHQPLAVLDKFLFDGGLESCFYIIENLEKHDDRLFRNIFAILFFVCTGSEHFLNFLQRHFEKVQLHYENIDKKSFENDLILRESIIFRNKMELFEDLLRNIFLVYRETIVALALTQEPIVVDSLQETVLPNLQCATFATEELQEKAYEEKYEAKPPSEAKLHSKRMKRRTRALKAKMTKMKNAELTDRLINSGQILTKQKSNLSVKSESIIKEMAVIAADTKTSSITKLLENEKSRDSTESLKFKKPWIRKEPQKNAKKTESKNYNKLSKIQFKINYDHFWSQPGWQEKFKLLNLEWPCNMAKGSDEKSHEIPNADTHISNKMVDAFDNDCLLDLSPLTNECDDISLENDSYKDSSLTFLQHIFQRIIDFYQTKWKMDRDEEYPHLIYGEYLPHDESRFEKLKIILPQLELEYIEKLKVSYNNLLEALKECSESDSVKYKRVVRTVEKLFLRHELRNQPNYPKSADLRSSHFGDCIRNIEAHENEIKIVIDAPHEMPTKLSQDELFINEMMSLPPRNISIRQERREENIYKEQHHNYHLVQSMLNICESDEETQRIKHWIQLDKRRTAARLSRSLDSTTNINIIDDVIQRIWEPTSPPPGFSTMMVYNNRSLSDKYPVYRSRWCNIVNELKSSEKVITFQNGDLRVSCTRLVDIISTEGNFGEISLGFDHKNRPLAVKRVSKHNLDICKKLASAVNSVLALRHQNILHYYLCDFDVDELVIATPLCEYNMGEYLMLTKFSENAHVATFDIVKQFLTGLNFLHERGVVHGNLKPSNIFVDLTGVVKIAEFGIHKALFQYIQPPNSSLIWFSRETYDMYKEMNTIECSRVSDVQVAGMLVHFLLTSGRHPFGEVAEEILVNLLAGKTNLKTKDVVLNDLLSWMLLFDAADRPSVNQVLKHVHFWPQDRKWRFLLSCAGIGTYGTPLSINMDQLHAMFEIVAKKEKIKGEWVSVCKDRFPAYNFTGNHSDTPVGLLKFMQEIVSQENCCHADVKLFFLEKFPALPLSLYRMLDMTKWMEHPVFKPFIDPETIIV